MDSDEVIDLTNDTPPLSPESNGAECDDEANSSIFIGLCHGLVDMECIKSLCCKWHKMYFAEPREAVVCFIGIVFEASGISYRIPAYLDLPNSYAWLVENATDQLKNDRKNFPSIIRGRKQIGKNVSNFVKQLLKIGLNPPIIVEENFLQHLTSFIFVASKSTFTHLRYTATLVGLTMIEALGDPRLTSDEKLLSVQQTLYEKVLHNSRGDVVDTIRALRVRECGRILNKFPKYFGGNIEAVKETVFDGLMDWSQEVLKISFKVLLQAEEKLPLTYVCLSSIIKYRERLVKLIESDMGEMAVKLLVRYYKVDTQVLTEDNKGNIERLVFDDDRSIGRAAAELLEYRFVRKSSGNRMLSIANYFHHEKFSNGKIKIIADRYVDSMYDITETVKDWRSMVRLLLWSEKTTAFQVTTIICIMGSAVKRSAIGYVPNGKESSDLKREPNPYAMQTATWFLMPFLCRIFRQPKLCRFDLEQLLELFPYVDFSTRFMMQLIDNGLVPLLHDSHSWPLLDACAKTLNKLVNKNADATTASRTSINSLQAEAVLKYLRAVSASELATNDRRRARFKRLNSSLRLLAALFPYFKFTDWSLASGVHCILKKSMHSVKEFNYTTVFTSIASYCVKILHSSMEWELIHASANPMDNEELESMRDRIVDLQFILFQAVEHPNIMNVAFMAFNGVCDLYLLSNKYFTGELRRMRSKPEYEEVEMLLQFVMDYVFDDTILNNEFQKREALSRFCQLAVHKVLNNADFSNIFRFYDQFYDSYGVIMLNALQEMSKRNVGYIVIRVCIDVFKSISEFCENPEHFNNSSEFNELLVLAESLSEVFENNMEKARSGVKILHYQGIKFALDECRMDDQNMGPPNGDFFKVLERFIQVTKKKLVIDIINHLDDLTEAAVENSNCKEKWQPLLSYRKRMLTYVTFSGDNVE